MAAYGRIWPYMVHMNLDVAQRGVRVDPPYCSVGIVMEIVGWFREERGVNQRRSANEQRIQRTINA